LLAICFSPSLSDSFIILTLTRLVVVLKFINFRFALFTPPSRRLSKLKMMKMKIKKSHLKRRTMIKGEMPLIKTRKMMRVQDHHT
jgi:hypothetical protein